MGAKILVCLIVQGCFVSRVRGCITSYLIADIALTASVSVIASARTPGPKHVPKDVTKTVLQHRCMLSVIDVSFRRRGPGVAAGAVGDSAGQQGAARAAADDVRLLICVVGGSSCRVYIA